MLKTKKNLKIEELERENEQMRVERDVIRAEMDCHRRRANFYEDQYKEKKDRPSWAFLLVAVVLSAIVTALAFWGVTSDAATVNRYTTQTVDLKNRVKGHTVHKVKRNTRVRLIKTGKRWAKVRYKGETLVCRKKFLHKYKSPKKYSGRYFRNAGVIWWRDQKFTWYSQRILPGYGLRIPGRHLDGQGFVCDGKGYIVLGSNTANRGKIIATPFGRYGKVYDAGAVGTYWFDCYVAW